MKNLMFALIIVCGGRSVYADQCILATDIEITNQSLLRKITAKGWEISSLKDAQGNADAVITESWESKIESMRSTLLPLNTFNGHYVIDGSYTHTLSVVFPDMSRPEQRYSYHLNRWDWGPRPFTKRNGASAAAEKRVANLIKKVVRDLPVCILTNL